MIRLAEAEDMAAAAGLCRNSAVGCRILSGMHAYGCDRPFFSVWLQTEGGYPAAVLARMDGSWSVAAQQAFDGEEARSLICAAGGEQVTARADVLSALGFAAREQICEMRLFPDRQAEAKPLPGLEWNPSPRVLYEVLSACEGPGIQLPPFEPWYLDLSHRMRHGAARAVLLRQEGSPVACAMTVAEADGEAVLGGVAVRPSCRGQGMGARVAGALLERLAAEGRTVHLMRETGRHERFYRGLGFEDTALLSIAGL